MTCMFELKGIRGPQCHFCPRSAEVASCSIFNRPTIIYRWSRICDGWCHCFDRISTQVGCWKMLTPWWSWCSRTWPRPGSSTRYTTTSHWPCCDERLPSATNRCCCCHVKAARNSGPSGPRRKDLGRTGLEWPLGPVNFLRWYLMWHTETMYEDKCKHHHHQHPMCKK